MSIALALLLAAAPEGRQLVDRIVAIVNEEVITQSELEGAARSLLSEAEDDERKKNILREVLDQMISERLISQQIVEAKISVEEEEVERAIKDILRQNNISEDELKQAVEGRGMTMGQYREDLKTQLIRLKIVDLKVRARVQISDAEVKAEYERVASSEARDELVSIRHIFFRWGDAPSPPERTRVMKAAAEARKRVLAGEDFAAVARAISEGPTAANGGDLGELGRKGLLPELARAVEKLKVGEISGPIETKNGVHLVKIEGRRTKEAAPFAEMRAQIYQRLYTAEVERQMRIWVDELRAESAVRVRL